MQAVQRADDTGGMPPRRRRRTACFFGLFSDADLQDWHSGYSPD